MNDELNDEKLKEVMDEVDKNLNKISLQIDDEIDLEEFRIHQDFTGVQVRGEMTFVPVQKPNSQDWVFIPSKNTVEWTTVPLLELKQKREFYLVSPAVAASLDGDVTTRLLVPYADKEGGLFLWPIRLSDARGDLNSWVASAIRVVNDYNDRWIRIKARLNAGCYEVFEAPTVSPAPIWPTDGIKFFVNRAFKGKIITFLEHPIIRQLKGY
jgi:hypothetical protein